MTKQFLLKQLDNLEDLKGMQQLEQIVWNMEPIPIHQTLTAVKNGGIVIGAFDSKKIIGFAYGFPGYIEGKVYFCSHMMGIHPDYRKLGLGEQIKSKQQGIAIEMGYTLITWTFDPLENINAYLNLHKLRGIAAQYLENNYGSMNDKLNKGLPSDRFKIEWWITSNHVNKEQSYLSNIKFDKNKALLRTKVNSSNYPIITSEIDNNSLLNQIAEYEILFIPIPVNFQQLKNDDMQLAIDWRLKTRPIFQMLLDKGYVAIDVVRVPEQNINYYVFMKKNLLAI